LETFLSRHGSSPEADYARARLNELKQQTTLIAPRVQPPTGDTNLKCVVKAGKGTAGSEDGAKFQAWETILQATDWGSWAAFMTAGAKVPTAPGYKVSDLKSRCRPGELGHVCIIQAQLCKDR
jgi:hypothetical protein